MGDDAEKFAPKQDEGMLDVVVLIDKSGSMSDDIECVQREVDTMLAELSALARKDNISLQVGLVTFSYTGTANVFEECRLSADIESTRQFVKKLDPGKVGGDEDLFSALMHAMNQPVDGKQIDMGWRRGAAKIAVPVTDEAPKTWNFTLSEVAGAAERLDPVHVYPLLTPKGGFGWLDPADRSLKELAQATGGQTVRVRDAKALPQAIVGAVKLAISRHKEEIWRRENPPIGLFVVAGVISILAVGATVAAILAQFRQHRRATALAGGTVSEHVPDPILTGQYVPVKPND